jgi:hypothetical protein
MVEVERDVAELIVAGAVADGGAGKSADGIKEGDHGAGNDGAGGIGDIAQDAAVVAPRLSPE